MIDVDSTDKNLMVTAAQNPDGSVAVVVFNEGMEQKSFELITLETTKQISISPQANSNNIDY